MIKLAPSILSADFAHLGRDVKLVTSAGAQMIHVDVMDGHFVPNLSIGPQIVKSLRRDSDAFLDVHLMITDPEKYTDAYIDAGANLINFHVEANGDPEKLLKHIRERGVKSAVTIKPKTPAEEIFKYLDLCDMVLVMSVEPGFGGQSFMEGSLPKVRALADEIKKRKLSCDIQIDGGINLETGARAVKAGATSLVAGTAVFGAPDIAERVKEFLKL
ncbi:MAG: ribulose-phosphate 3-epimerase [Clostridia bacterium]|nr:ribulose-phosphate 3-epimerase [Clostridia bacterium]